MFERIDDLATQEAAVRTTSSSTPTVAPTATLCVARSPLCSRASR